MRKYELVVIIKAGLGKAGDKLPAFLKKVKAKITDKKELGVKELAYPIQKEAKGLYVQYIIEASGNLGQELDRFFHLNSKNYLRYLLVVRED